MPNALRNDPAPAPEIVSSGGPTRHAPGQMTEREAAARGVLATFAHVANLLAAGIMIGAIVGWLIDSKFLQTFGADFPSVQLSTALAFLIATGALIAARRPTAVAQRRARIGAAVVAAIAALMLAGRAMGVQAGLDLAFLGLGSDTNVPGVMPVATALTLLLVAAGIVLSPLAGPRAELAHRAVAGAIVGIATLALVGLSFRLLLLYGVAPLFGMALPSGIAFLLLGASLLAGRPDAWLLDLLTSERPGAVLSRWLLPAAIVVPIVAHLLQLAGQYYDLVDEALGEGTLVLLTIAGIGALTLWVAREVDRMNARRQRAEEDARTQRESLQVVLASIGDGVIATDRFGRVRFLNAAAQRLTGRSEAAAVGHAVGEVLHVVDEQTGREVELPLERALQSGEIALGIGEPALRVAGGALHPVELSAAPILDPRGEVTGAVLIAHDAAQRRAGERAMRRAYGELDARVIERTAALEQATVALRERTRLLGTITASTSELIFAKDVEGRLLMVNAAYRRAIGKEERDLLGRSSVELATDPEAGRAKAEHDRVVIESGQSLTVEEIFPAASGPRIYLTTKSPLRDEQGQIVGLVGVATDITERKRAERELEILVVEEQQLREEAERANRAKDEFLAIVSHELRSPLNALRGWGHLLASTRPLEAGLLERATAAIKRNVEHQARLIDDILDTSRSMSGKLTLERHAANLVDVVHAAIEIARPGAAAKRIELRVTLGQPRITVEGDPGRLQQVLTNLLSNAIKFTPQDGTIETSVRRVADRIRLAVRDNGAGIAPEFLPHVFERFTQADTSTTRRAGGLGIGLALVRNIIELHGGEVRAESEGPGRGATFTVELPAPPAGVEAERVPTAPEERAPGAGRLTGLGVCLVDDDPDARDTIGLALRHAGASVELFESGEALLARLEERLPASRPDVLLLDLAMPGEDGFAVLARVRSMEGDLGVERVPAIAVTAFTQVDRQRLRVAGFQDRVGKPVDADRLVAAIQALVGNVASGQAAASHFRK